MTGFSSSRSRFCRREVNRRGMSPQPAKSPAKCGVTRGGNWSALHPCAPYIERTVLGRMIAPPDHLTIRPNPACRIGFAGLNPSCKLTTRTAQVICPSESRCRHSSCPGLTRASIHLRKTIFEEDGLPGIGERKRRRPSDGYARQ